MVELKKQIDTILREIERVVPDSFVMMEVCGTHTMNIAKFGLRALLPKNIRIISGPGCPVCVTPSKDIKRAIEISKLPNTIIATFGDMLRIPVNGDSLQNHRNVKVIYSPMEGIALAKANTNMNVVLLGVGFETTAPLTATVIREAKKMNLNNFSVLCMHKTVPPALEIIMKSKSVKINGFLLPGHVCTITGSDYFNFISKFGFCGVVAGFEALNIISSINELIKHFIKEEYGVFNSYNPVVTGPGNPIAHDVVKDVYVQADSFWRGIGLIKRSGLKIRDQYSKYDAEKRFDLKIADINDPINCRCGDILKGESSPTDCIYYGKQCTPSSPIGPCMVSTEGTCAAFYKYMED